MKLLLLVVLYLPTVTYGFSTSAQRYDKLRFSVEHNSSPGRAASVVLAASPSDDTDKAFEDLKKQVRSNPQESLDDLAVKTKKWTNQFFDLCVDVNRDLSEFEDAAVDVARNERDIRKQQELTNQVIDFAVKLGREWPNVVIENDPSNCASRPWVGERPRTSAPYSIFEPVFAVTNNATVFQVTMELPGVSLKDINIEIDEDTNYLIVSGKRQSLRTNQIQTFSKNFMLDPDVDQSKVSAKLDMGILTVSAPKKNQSTSRRVSVSIN